MNKTLVRADLRLFKLKQKTNSSVPMKLYRVDVIDNASNKPVVSQMISSRKEGWQVFQISDVVHSWIIESRRNKGLQVFVRSDDSANGSSPFSHHLQFDYEPILVLYLNDKTHQDFNLLSGLPINTTAVKASMQKGHKRVRRRARKHRPCRVEDLQVPLNQIGWYKNIIAPVNFDINQCKGHCGHHASKSYLGQTNHALLQALLAAVTERVSYPCCSPTKFEHGTALMIDEKLDRNGDTRQKIKIVQLNKMKVTKCECL